MILSISNIRSNNVDKVKLSFSKEFPDYLISSIKSTFMQIKAYKETLKFLIARLIYNDALITIFAFGGPYAKHTLGFSMSEVLVFAIVLNVAAGIGSFIFGLIIGEEITAWLIFALWIMSAGVWLPNILQVIWWRFNSWGFLSAWIANLGLSWLVVWILPRFGIIPELPDYLQFWALIILNAMIYLPVTFLTKPEKMDHLVAYYVMSRPIGFWGPVRKEAIKQGLIKSS